MKHRLMPCLLLAATLPFAAHADNWRLSTTFSDFSGQGAPNAAAIDLQWQGKPLWQPGGWRIGPAAAISWDSQHSQWGGIGLSARRNLAPRWIVEFSEMPGIYRPGTARTELGGPVEFRTQLSLGYVISRHLRLEMGIYHRSNAGLYHDNPGVNSVTLGLTRQF